MPKKEKKNEEACCAHKRKKGLMMLVLGLLILANIYLAVLGWPAFISLLLIIAGLLKLISPYKK